MTLAITHCAACRLYLARITCATVHARGIQIQLHTAIYGG